MHYTSYTGITDDDIHALYTYLQSLPKVARKVPQTDLPFPFIRPVMIAWNLLNLKTGEPVGAKPAEGEAATRGRYLVEALGHCTTCHTPRDALMGQRSDMHLSGAPLSGWDEPKITPDPSGIGGWSDMQLAGFLHQGHNDIAAAGGEMGLAAPRSLRLQTH